MMKKTSTKKVLVIILLVLLGVIGVMSCSFKKTTIEKASSDSWEIREEAKSSRTKTHTFILKEGYHLEISTSANAGSLSIKVTESASGKVLYDGEGIENRTFQVEGTGKVKVTVKEKKYIGTYTVKVRK